MYQNGSIFIQLKICCLCFLQLRYWKSSEGRHKWKEVDIIVDTGNRYILPDVRAAIEGLPAYTALRAQVSVMNGHYTGPPSLTVDFVTPEGGELFPFKLVL